MRRFGLLLLVVLLTGYLLSGLTFIRPGERAVVRRFGRVLREKPAPGLWLGLPWGIDRVDRVPVNLVRRVEVGYQGEGEEESTTTPPGQLLTGDHNLVDVRVVLQYAVDPQEEQIVNYVLQANQAEDLLARAAEAFLAEWVAAHTIDDLLIRGKSTLPPVLLKQTQERIQAYQLGIQVRGASVDYLLPPQRVKAAFDDVTRAQANIRTREQENQLVAAKRLRQAEADRYKKEQEAQSYARQQHLDAEADAATFIKRQQQYERLRQTNPDILTAIWWDEMGKLFARLKKDGRIDLLDNNLAGDGMDITLVPPLPKKN